MLFGLNLQLFGGTADKKMLGEFGRIREIGFDGVEVPVHDPSTFNVDAVRKAAEKYQLRLTACGSPPKGSSFYSAAAAPRKRAERYFSDAVRVVADLGATVFSGPFFKPVGDFDQSIPLREQRQKTAVAMKGIAQHCAASGIQLAFEPLNRFETNFLNTIEDSIAFVKKLGHGAGLLLDTFHMHIEEKDTPSAIRQAMAAGVLLHFHASENDRGIPGTGQVHWSQIASALLGAGYSSWVVLESFSQTIEEIKRAVSCWRPFFSSAEAYMRDGLRFVKSEF